MKIILAFLISIIAAAAALTYAQPLKRDTAVFIEKKNELFDFVMTSLDKYHKKDDNTKKEIVVDFASFNPACSF